MKDASTRMMHQHEITQFVQYKKAIPNEIPSNLIKQLKPTGRMVLPLNIDGSQKLFRIKNTKNGLLKKEVDDVLFVPMLEGVN